MYRRIRLVLTLSPIAIFVLVTAFAGGEVFIALCVGLVFSLVVGAFTGHALFMRVVLYEDGVAVRGLSRSRAMAFDYVDEVWFESVDTDTGIVSSVRLRDHDGADLRVPITVENGNALFETILDRCSTPLLDQAIATLEAGETLHFANISLSNKQISFGKKSVNWTEIGSARLRPFAIDFYGDRAIPLHTVKLSRVPHPRVFLSLVRLFAPNDEAVIRRLGFGAP